MRTVVIDFRFVILDRPNFHSENWYTLRNLRTAFSTYLHPVKHRILLNVCKYLHFQSQKSISISPNLFKVLVGRREDEDPKSVLKTRIA